MRMTRFWNHLQEEVQTKQWPNEEQTIQWPKDRQCNGQTTDNAMAKRQTMQWPKGKEQKV